MATCDLCDLPTPDPPVTDPGVDGVFCCRGCLAVADRLGTVGVDPDGARAALDADDPGPDDPGPDDPAQDDPIDAEGAETAFLAVDGMHCATCEAFVEWTATREDGVIDARASYASGVAKLVFDPDRVARDDIPGILSGMGYAAHPAGDRRDDRHDPPWRLLVGAFVAMPVMMWYLVFLYPRYLGFAPESPAWSVGPTSVVSLANLWVITTVVLLYTGFPILRGAYVSLRTGRPNMDLLVSLAAVNAYLYSGLVVLTGGTEVYFDITIAVVLVVTLGNHYESRIRRRAAGRLSSLAEERIDAARRLTGTEPGIASGRGTEPGIASGPGTKTETVDVSDLAASDEVLVRPGERIPIDGTVVSGEAAVDESLVTGESVPVAVGPGDPVVGGAVATDGALVVEVGDGAESTVDRLVDLLWEAQSTRPGAGRLADRIAAAFVPLVLLVAAAAFGWQVLGGAPLSGAVLTGLAVLVVSCPCALGLATPLAVASGTSEALGRGIVVTDASAFETAPDVDVVAFDKTGTLTTGEMRVLDPGDREALSIAAAVEAYSEHPVAEAIVERAPATDRAVAGFERHPGRGVTARVGGRDVAVGSPTLLRERGLAVPGAIEDRVDAARSAGHVPVLVGWEGRARSVIVVGDQPREGWAEAIAAVAERGLEVVVLTGDSEAAASRFREHPDVRTVFAGVPPDAKAAVVERLRARGSVAMVGDGTNDAPALAAADLGIALGRATAIASDAADAVVTTGDLEGVTAVFDVTAGANRRIRENLGWAFVYNAVAIPVAAAGLLNPLVAAAAMATSSLLVVGNSARPILPRERPRLRRPRWLLPPRDAAGE